MDKPYIQVDRHQYRIKTQSNSPSLLSKAFTGMILDIAFQEEHGECLKDNSETDSGLQYLISEENACKKKTARTWITLGYKREDIFKSQILP